MKLTPVDARVPNTDRPAGARNEKMNARRAEKVAQAAERQAYRATLSPKQQLEVLDQRLGKGVGAVKERARLAELIKNPPKPQAQVVAKAEGPAEPKENKAARKKGEGRVKQLGRRLAEPKGEPSPFKSLAQVEAEADTLLKQELPSGRALL